MTETDLDILATKLASRMTMPRWMKLVTAAHYSGYGQKKLKKLAKEGKIRGYQDPDSDRGDWVFDRESIDEYRLLPCIMQDKKAVDILKSL